MDFIKKLLFFSGFDVRVVNDGLGFILFFFFYFILSYFEFLFLYLDIRQRRQNVTCHIGVTQWSHSSHTHIIQWNDIEGSRDNNIIWHG